MTNEAKQVYRDLRYMVLFPKRKPEAVIEVCQAAADLIDHLAKNLNEAQARCCELGEIAEGIAHGDSPCDYCTLDCAKAERSEAEEDETCACFLAAFSKVR